MKERDKNILLDSVIIGYSRGRKKNALLPPLSASASGGELISVIGRNGIGKSTLLRSLAGIQEVLGGQILINGKKAHEYSGNQLARLTGFISTEPVRVSNMTVFDLVSLGRFPYTNLLGTMSSHDVSIVWDAMEKASVINFSEKYFSELSDGERQRSMIARLLAQDTLIMLMDEPTAFLDIKSKFDIMHLLHELTNTQGKTIIITTHDLDLALRHSDKIWLVLDDAIREGAPEDLMLDGSFGRLFDSASVRFNTDEGTYSFIEVTKGSVYVEAVQPARRWTEKALERAGFSVSKTRIPDCIKIEGNSRWILTYRGNRHEYSSIYELMSGLNSLT